jgi:hypothetical protein
MVEIIYKKKTEKRYKLNGAWWTIPDIDKVVTFENMDTGGFLHGVILSRVDGNEWRVIEEGSSRHLKPVETEVEPEFLELAVLYKLEADEAPMPCEELLHKVLGAIDYYGGEQIGCITGIVDGEDVTYFIRLEKGYNPIKEMLNAVAGAVAKLGLVVRYTRTEEGVEDCSK